MKVRPTRRPALAGVAVLVVVALAAVPGQAQEPQPAQPAQGVKGNFSLIMMVHTNSSTFGDLPGVQPWNGRARDAGDTMFRYRSIPCTGNAPVNNISSDLPSYGNRVAGSRSPASMRAHPFQFKVRKVRGRYQMRGNITFTVCKLGGGPTPDPDPIPDAQKPRIEVTFVATFKRMNAENLNWSGTFRIRGGTQRYEGLTGSGVIAGYFMCFAPQGCASLNRGYLDGQMVLRGRYEDPTPQLTTG